MPSNSDIVFLFFSAQTRDVPDQIPLTVVKRGDNVTLTCPVIDDEAGLFYWYKLKFGYMVQTVAAGSFKKLKLEGQFDKSRFTITRGNAQYFLHITNVTKEDEATYFCQEGASDKMKNFNGVLLAVNGKVCLLQCFCLPCLCQYPIHDLIPSLL